VALTRSAGPRLPDRRHQAIKPRPRNRRPTLLYDTKNDVLTLDRDGTGPISDKVVVKLSTRFIQSRGALRRDLTKCLRTGGRCAARAVKPAGAKIAFRT
jgi:hypothetical protein